MSYCETGIFLFKLAGKKVKRCIIALNVIFLICSVNIPDVSAKQAFTDSIFKETFEKGRAFAFVKILSVHSETIYNSTIKEL